MGLKYSVLCFFLLISSFRPAEADPTDLQELSDTLGKMSKYCKDAADSLESSKSGLSTKTEDSPRPEPRVEFLLSSPAGKSPKVFSRGWPFRARCLIQGRDYSDYITWTGTGSFSPKHGALCYPDFLKDGANSITLSVLVNGKRKTQSFNLVTVDPSRYAHVGSKVVCPADAHSGVCPTCPHPVAGKILSGSSTVSIAGMPAARVGDVGKHCCCCGPNRFSVETGDSEVLIDGFPAARINDRTRHCGGIGSIVAGDLGDSQDFPSIPSELPVTISLQTNSGRSLKKGDEFCVVCKLNYSGNKTLEQFLEKKLIYKWSTGNLQASGRSESGNSLLLSSAKSGKYLVSCTVLIPGTLQLYEMFQSDSEQIKNGSMLKTPRIIGTASLALQIEEGDLDLNNLDARMLGDWTFHMGNSRMPTQNGDDFRLPIRMTVKFRADGTVIAAGASGSGARWQKSGNRVKIEGRNGFEEFTLTSDGNSLIDRHGVIRYQRAR